jgi:hypothetical protein
MRWSRVFAVALVALFVSVQTSFAVDPWGLKEGSVELKSAGPLAFGPDGILFVGDPSAAAVVAIGTDDAKADAPKEGINIADFQQKLGAAVEAKEAKVVDLAISPVSRNIYLSVSTGQGTPPAIVRISGDGKISKVALEKVRNARAALADAPDPSAQGRRGSRLRDSSITDLAFVDGKVFVSGVATGAKSMVRELTFPFSENSSGTNIEIFHAAHGRVEDDAPVRTFAPFVLDGEPVLLAGFTCTPLVKIPVKTIGDEKKIRGTTVAELGNRNQPLDMIVYTKDGKRYLLMSNSARGVMKISTDKIAENEGLTEPVRGGGTAGQSYETIKELQGVEQLDKLDDDRAVIITKGESSLELKTIELP